jgi:hypothetical protein
LTTEIASIAANTRKSTVRLRRNYLQVAKLGTGIFPILFTAKINLDNHGIRGHFADKTITVLKSELGPETFYGRALVAKLEEIKMAIGKAVKELQSN